MIMKKILLLSMTLLCACLSKAQAPVDSITNTRSMVVNNQPVSHIVVTSTGDLTLSSTTTITICSPFEVMLGGLLNVNASLPAPITFEYDNSGNRIARKLDD